MKKRLLLLLCLLVTAGSAAWADIASGNCKNGSWKIDDSGKLTVNIDGKMADYGEGKAPWYGYAEQITAIHIGSGCKNVGRNGFYGLRWVEKVTGGENVEAVAMYSFEECGKMIQEIYLPKCTYVGECAFRGCGAMRIVLPIVEEVRTKAFNGCPYLTQIDLGSKIEEIGVLAFSGCPQMWADDTPNIFMSNPTPPKLYTKLEASTSETIRTLFKDFGIGFGLVIASCIPFVGVAGGYTIGQSATYHNIQNAAENGDLEFAWDGLRINGSSGDFWDLAIDDPWTMSSLYDKLPTDKWYNPFAPRPDGKGWTEGEPIICVPANLVKTYRDYYFEAENMKTGNWGYIDDDAEGMGTNGDRSKSAHGAIMAGGKLGSTFDQGFWMLQSRTTENVLEADPRGTDDALVIGGNLREIGMSAVNGLKSQVKALYISSNSLFPEGAFQSWTNLEYVYMASGSVIDGSMFKDCTNLVKFEGYPSTDINPSAFEGCTKLHSFIAKGNGIQNVAACAFKGCTSLYEVKLPRVKYIQNEAFMGCSNLRSLFSSGLLSENMSAQYDIEYIGESAFEGCKNLHDISMQNLQSLGKRAFYGCKTLSEFAPGPYFSYVPEEAFASSGITRIVLTGNNNHSFLSKSFADTNLTINSDITQRGIFDTNSDYGHIGNMPSDAFGDLELKDIPLHTSYAAYSRYESNNMLNQMKFIPYDVNYMNWTVDRNGWELTYSGILTVGKNYPALYKTKPEEYDWYPYRDLIKKVMVEDGVTQISKSEFEGLTRVTDVHIPRSVKIISEGAFRGCTSLRNIYITRVENIGSYAFEGCSSLETIELDEKLKKAGDYIFKNCISLTDITNKEETPAEITELTFKDIKSPVYDSRRNAMAKAGETSTVNLHVPRYAVLNYMIDENWSQLHIDYADDRGTWEKAGKFGDGAWILYDDGTMVISANKGYPRGNSYEVAQKELKFAADPNNPKDTDPILLTKRLEIDGNITELGAYFANFKNLEEVVLKAPVHLLDGTFWACEKLANISTANIDTIRSNTFYHTALTSLSLPKIKLIESGAFARCDKLETVQLGPSCELKASVFENCTSLTNIDLSTAVGSGFQLFKNCTSLKGVIFHGTEVGQSMFEGCTSLEEIDLGENLKKVGKFAFGGCTALKTIYVSSPTPPTLWKVMDDVTVDGTTQHVQVSPFISSDLTGEVNYKEIELQVPNTFIVAYASAMRYLWHEMNIVKDEEYEEDLLPVSGSLSGYDTKWNHVSNGSWSLDTEGRLFIDCQGDMAAYCSKEIGGLYGERYWYNTFSPWLYFIKTVEVSDDVTSLADYMFTMDMEDVANSSAGVTTVILGEKFQKAGYAAFPFSGIKDVYIYAEDLVSLHPNSFNMDAVIANNATLHVLKHVDDKYLNYYKGALYATQNFPNIVDDLEPKDPKVQAVWFDLGPELTMYVGQSIQLDPQFTPANVKNKTLRYNNLLPNYNVSIDENGVMTAMNEGVAYIEAFSSYTVDGEELQATWGPLQEIYLKVTITAEPQKEDVFFDVFAYEATDAPFTTYHVLRDEHIDVDNEIKTCEVAGQYNEDDITTQAIPEWRTGTVIIPEEAQGYEVVRLGAYSFYERQIRVLYIPWTVKEIGTNACARCDYLTDVYVTSFQPLKFTDAYGDPMEESMGHNDAFYRIGEGDDGEGYATLHVPAGSKTAWDIYPWNEWFRYIVEDSPIPDGINEIKSDGFGMKNDGSWFDLSGRKLGMKPTAPGLYIVNGRKVVIK